MHLAMSGIVHRLAAHLLLLRRIGAINSFTKVGDDPGGKAAVD